MDVVAGAVIAVAVAWASILLAVWLPAPKLRVEPIMVQRAGAAAIATIAASALGLALPLWTALAVFAVALLGQIALAGPAAAAA